MATADEHVETDPRPMPAEFQYLLVVMALFALLLLAGVPARELEPAGDGSNALRKGWAARRQAQALAEEAARTLPQESAAER